MTIRAFLHLFFMAALVSCVAAQPDTDTEEPYRIVLTTSGGITGRGSGTVTIESSGTVSVTTMTGKQCSFEASAADLRAVGEMARLARPSRWVDSYVPKDPCCDRIEYRLTLERGETEQREVVWIDDPLPLPEDLAALAAAVGRVRAEYGGRCDQETTIRP